VVEVGVDDHKVVVVEVVFDHAVLVVEVAFLQH